MTVESGEVQANDGWRQEEGLDVTIKSLKLVFKGTLKIKRLLYVLSRVGPEGAKYDTGI